MIVITILIAVERLVARRALGVTIVAIVVGALAVGLAGAPRDLPG